MAQKGADNEPKAQRPVVRLILTIKDTLLLPLRLATSRFAVKAYITTFLFFVTAVFLFALALLSYILFYWSYIPRIGFEREIYLQYDTIPVECRPYLLQPQQPHRSLLDSLTLAPDATDARALESAAACAGAPAPWGEVTIAPDAVTQQAYDVVLSLVLPRTPTNEGAGLFMVDARLLSSSSSSTSPHNPRYTNAFASLPSTSTALVPTTVDPESTVLARARRPAFLPFTPHLTRLARTFITLPWTVFISHHSASQISLRVPLFTRVSFPTKSSASPASARPHAFHVQLQNPQGAQLRVHAATVEFRARFTGLRWAMYNFRLATGAVFVGAFFTMECIAAAAVYGFLAALFFSSGSGSSAPAKSEARIKNEGGAETRIKTEEAEETDVPLSDADRTFPSYGALPPLRYAKAGEVKVEDGEKPAVGLVMAAGAEADDEDDEDADFVLDDTGRWRDSGLGTSMESGRDVAGVRRRRSRGGSSGQGRL